MVLQTGNLYRLYTNILSNAIKSRVSAMITCRTTMDKTKSVNTAAIINMPVAIFVIWIQNHFLYARNYQI